MKSFLSVRYRRARTAAFASITVAAAVLASALLVPALTSAAPAATVAACTAADLQVWLGLGEGGATAGSTYFPLEFSNISSAPCSLDGYPSVFAANSSGAQLGSAAGKSTTAPVSVILATDATASANLQVTDVSAFTASACVPVKANSLSVEPPGTTTHFDVPYGVEACSKAGPVYLNVPGYIQAGAGIPGYTS